MTYTTHNVWWECTLPEERVKYFERLVVEESWEAFKKTKAFTEELKEQFNKDFRGNPI